jgi:predicted metal-dependent hydrolase
MLPSLSSADYLEFKRGIREFNAGAFFQCHETLESVWRRQAESDKELTQGIIQVAVAYYHLGRGNYVGARKLFERAKPRLEKFLPAHLNVDVQGLHELVLSMLEKLYSGAISEAPVVSPMIRVTDP